MKGKRSALIEEIKEKLTQELDVSDVYRELGKTFSINFEVTLKGIR